LPVDMIRRRSVLFERKTTGKALVEPRNCVVESVRVLPVNDHAEFVMSDDAGVQVRRPLPSLSMIEFAAPCTAGRIREYPVMLLGGCRRIAFDWSEGWMILRDWCVVTP